MSTVALLLEDVGWQGEAWFRVLDTYFSLRHNDTLLGDYVERVLGRFRVPPDPLEVRSPPTPNVPPRYSLVSCDGDGDGDPSAARYLLYYGDTLLIDTPTTGYTLTHLFWHVNAEAIRQTGSFFLAHAGCVLAPSGAGLVLPAESGSGKTTLVTALVKAGFGYLSDEAAVVDPVSGSLHPFPKALTIKTGSFPLFPELAAEHLGSLVPGTWHVHPDQLRPGAAVTGSCDPGWIVPIRYDPEVDGAQLSPLRPAEVVVELAGSSLNLHRYGIRALPLLAQLARRAGGFRLRFGNLDAAVEALTDLTASPDGGGGSRPAHLQA